MRASSEATARDAGAIASQTGTIANTGPAGDVVRRLGVRLERLLRHLVASLVAGAADRVDVEAHVVIPVVWPPLAVITWPCTKFDHGEQRKKIGPGGVLRASPAGRAG